MKTTRIAALAALAMIAAGNAMASDIELNIEGLLLKTTCQVESAEKHTRTVTLPNVAITALNQNGMTAGYKREQFAVTGCELDRTGVKLTFDTQANVSANGNLVNTDSGAGAATNVEVQMLNGATNAVLNLKTDNPEFAITNGAATLDLGFQYYATAATTEGTVKSQMLISLGYN